ncbi:MAG: 50S ribosomal protein L1 [Phycisphaeraceae bacterium]|nr:50S ribosomal protein L1 [Phycisphaeraceae bacterium]
MARLSKRAKSNEPLRQTEALQLPEAVTALKRFKGPRFDQTVEIAVHLNMDTKQTDQSIRGSVSLPKGIGKAKRVVAFCPLDKVAEARDAGALEAGGADLVEKIEKGWMDFDVAIASPDMMRDIAKLGRVLGPRGLMPSPKAGTVTPNVAQAVKEYSAGKVEYRSDKGGNVHAVVGKMSFPEGDLVENITHFLHTLERARPSSTKGAFIKNVAISGTMTPGVQVKHSEAVVAV